MTENNYFLEYDEDSEKPTTLISKAAKASAGILGNVAKTTAKIAFAGTGIGALNHATDNKIADATLATVKGGGKLAKNLTSKIGHEKIKGEVSASVNQVKNSVSNAFHNLTLNKFKKGKSYYRIIADITYSTSNSSSNNRGHEMTVDCILYSLKTIGIPYKSGESDPDKIDLHYLAIKLADNDVLKDFTKIENGTEISISLDDPSDKNKIPKVILYESPNGYTKKLKPFDGRLFFEPTLAEKTPFYVPITAAYTKASKDIDLSGATVYFAMPYNMAHHRDILCISKSYNDSKANKAIIIDDGNNENKIKRSHLEVQKISDGIPVTVKIKIKQDQSDNHQYKVTLDKIVEGKDFNEAKNILKQKILDEPENILDPNVKSTDQKFQKTMDMVVKRYSLFTTMHFEVSYIDPKGKKGKVKLYAKTKEAAGKAFADKFEDKGFTVDDINIVEENTMAIITDKILSAMNEVDDFDSLPSELQELILAQANNILDNDDDSVSDETDTDDLKQIAAQQDVTFDDNDLLMVAQEMMIQLYESSLLVLKLIHHGLGKCAPVGERIQDRNCYNEVSKLFKDIIVDQYMDFVKSSYLGNAIKEKHFVSNIDSIQDKLKECVKISNDFTFGSRISIVYDYLNSVCELLKPVIEKIASELDSEDDDLYNDDMDTDHDLLVDVDSYINKPIHFYEPNLKYLYNLNDYII